MCANALCGALRGLLQLPVAGSEKRVSIEASSQIWVPRFLQRTCWDWVLGMHICTESVCGDPTSERSSALNTRDYRVFHSSACVMHLYDANGCIVTCAQRRTLAGTLLVSLRISHGSSGT